MPFQSVVGVTAPSAGRADALTLTFSFLLMPRLHAEAPCKINKVLSHPTLPITITAQEDRHIQFFDNNTGTPRRVLSFASFVASQIRFKL